MRYFIHNSMLPIRKYVTEQVIKCCGLSNVLLWTRRYETLSTSEPRKKRFATTSKESQTCILCDCSHSSWRAHASTPSHIARVAICNTFAMPERCESIINQLHKHIQLDFNAVDELTMVKQERRRGRLRSTLQHLAEKNTIHFSLPYLRLCKNVKRLESTHSIESDKSKKCTAEKIDVENDISDMMSVNDKFINFIFIGNSFAEREVMDRVARLMPNISAIELSAIVEFILSERNLSRVFDLFDFPALILIKQRKLPELDRENSKEHERKTSNCVKITNNVYQTAKCVSSTCNNNIKDDSNDNTITTTTIDKIDKSCVVNSEENVNSHMESITTCTIGDNTVANEHKIFSSHEMLQLLTNSFPPLHMKEKSAIVFSVIGELYMYHQRDKSRSVADKAAAEALVQNVLATHTIENLMSELLHEILQKVVDEGIPVWRTFQAEQKERGRQDEVPQMLTLYDHPIKRRNNVNNVNNNNNNNSSSITASTNSSSDEYYDDNNEKIMATMPSANTTNAHVLDNNVNTDKMIRELKMFLPIREISLSEGSHAFHSQDTNAGVKASEKAGNPHQASLSIEDKERNVPIMGTTKGHIRLEWEEINKMLSISSEVNSAEIVEKSAGLTPRLVRKENRK